MVQVESFFLSEMVNYEVGSMGTYLTTRLQSGMSRPSSATEVANLWRSVVAKALPSIECIPSNLTPLS